MEFNYALLAKYLIGSLSSEEMEEVMRWRDLSAENETVFSEVFASFVEYSKVCG
mgnify:CR=1 FL=1